MSLFTAPGLTAKLRVECSALTRFLSSSSALPQLIQFIPTHLFTFGNRRLSSIENSTLASFESEYELGQPTLDAAFQSSAVFRSVPKWCITLDRFTTRGSGFFSIRGSSRRVSKKCPRKFVWKHRSSPSTVCELVGVEYQRDFLSRLSSFLIPHSTHQTHYHRRTNSSQRYSPTRPSGRASP